MAKLDLNYYAQKYPDIPAVLGNDPKLWEKHYYEYGLKEGREAYPGQPDYLRKFDAKYYAQTYPDVVAVVGDDPKMLYEHFCQFGYNEGRSAYAGYEKQSPNVAIGEPATPAVKTEQSDVESPKVEVQQKKVLSAAWAQIDPVSPFPINPVNPIDPGNPAVYGVEIPDPRPIPIPENPAPVNPVVYGVPDPTPEDPGLDNPVVYGVELPVPENPGPENPVVYGVELPTPEMPEPENPLVYGSPDYFENQGAENQLNQVSSDILDVYNKDGEGNSGVEDEDQPT